MPLENAWELPGHLMCPQCKRYLKWASGVQNQSRPDPGDNTICSDCAAILTFTDSLGVRFATPKEIVSRVRTGGMPARLRVSACGADESTVVDQNSFSACLASRSSVDSN